MDLAGSRTEEVSPTRSAHKPLHHKNASSPSKKQPLKFETGFPLFSASWSPRVGSDNRFNLALGSFVEDTENTLLVITFDPSTNEMSTKASAHHPNPPTKIMWYPSFEESAPPLLASCGDYLRLWKLIDRDSSDDCELVVEELLNNNGTTCRFTGKEDSVAPLTSFAWSSDDPNVIGTSCVDGSCSFWDITTCQQLGKVGVSGKLNKQIICHSREVFDLAFQPGSSKVFASVSGDGSLRMCDLRSPSEVTIMYETKNRVPLLRMSWNLLNPNHMCVVPLDSCEVSVVDMRATTSSARVSAELRSGSRVNSAAWSPINPQSNQDYTAFANHIVTTSLDETVEIWDVFGRVGSSPGYKKIECPTFRASTCEVANEVSWNPCNPEYLAVTIESGVQILNI